MNASPDSSTASNRSQAINFDAIIVDEAAQAVEPSTIIPFKYNPKVFLLCYSINFVDGNSCR